MLNFFHLVPLVKIDPTVAVRKQLLYLAKLNLMKYKRIMASQNDPPGQTTNHETTSKRPMHSRQKDDRTESEKQKGRKMVKKQRLESYRQDDPIMTQGTTETSNFQDQVEEGAVVLCGAMKYAMVPDARQLCGKRKKTTKTDSISMQTFDRRVEGEKAQRRANDSKAKWELFSGLEEITPGNENFKTLEENLKEAQLQAALDARWALFCSSKITTGKKNGETPKENLKDDEVLEDLNYETREEKLTASIYSEPIESDMTETESDI